MVKRTFERDYLRYKLDLPFCAVEDKVVGNSRWSIQHEIVFQDADGRFYQTTYSVGATEDQEEGPWEYDKLVDCVEVEKREVVVTKWMPV